MSGESGSDTGAGPGGPGDPVGTIGEEAAKLMSALQDWAKESGSEYADATVGAAAGVASTLRQVNEHLATDSAECRYCPVCQVIAAVRSTSPEVREHLGSAASSLLQAAAGILATPTPGPGARRDGAVEKITLSDGDDAADDDADAEGQDDR